jgi:serine/threonine-protein kinase
VGEGEVPGDGREDKEGRAPGEVADAPRRDIKHRDAQQDEQRDRPEVFEQRQGRNGREQEGDEREQIGQVRVGALSNAKTRGGQDCPMLRQVTGEEDEQQELDELSGLDRLPADDDPEARAVDCRAEKACEDEKADGGGAGGVGITEEEFGARAEPAEDREGDDSHANPVGLVLGRIGGQPDDESEPDGGEEERNRIGLGKSAGREHPQGKVSCQRRNHELGYDPGGVGRKHERSRIERTQREQHEGKAAQDEREFEVAFPRHQLGGFHRHLNAADIIDGRYRLERLLGTGGMAEVWLAEDQRLGRWVAIKALRESFTAGADAETIAAFEREATVIARLQHSGVVAVYDAGSHEGRRYIVMEYVHGYSLRQLLETQGRLPEREAIRYGVQVAAALQYAHDKGVVHCDIKPENVLVNESGVAKVADFGVAESLTRTMAPGQAKDLLGTVAYLAPEVIEGANPSPSSDVYSLALTVFELVAGRTPFSGSTAGAAIGQRLGAPPPPLRAFARSASPELEAVLSRALSLNPADRYPTAAALGNALGRVPATQNQPVAPIAAPPGRPPQLQTRHTTARIRRTPAPVAASQGVSGTAILVAVGIVLVSLGLGIVAAFALSRQNNDGGGGSATPTPTQTAAAISATATARPQTAVATATATPTPTGVPTTPPASSPTVAATPTRTPTPTPTKPPASPTAGETIPANSATAAATATP